MAQSRMGARLMAVLVAAIVSWTLVGGQQGPAQADVASVSGSAFGFSTSVSLFGGPAVPRGPAPTVTLPAAGSATPITASAATGDARYGPGIIFTSGAITVSTEGTTGPSGRVTTSTQVQTLNTSGQEILTAVSATSTCSASEAATTGSATFTGGRLQTSEGNPAVDGDETFVDIPANPAPNLTITGNLEGVGDTFRYVFNEQVVRDGGITVNAAHQYLLGPTAVGDLIVGQSVCAVSAEPAPTTTSSTSSTSTTVATTTTTASAGTVSGGASGFFTSVGLFGGAPVAKGPTPTVELPAAGSATAITGAATTGSAQYGPATIFTSGPIEVSTKGVPGGTVESSAKVATLNTSTQEILTAESASSTCSASKTDGTKGSTTFVGGKVQTSAGDPNRDGDETFADVPANPEPNRTVTGKLEDVGDTFKYVFNEQIVGSDGSITVNAAHQYLLGPTAVGDVVIGQSRCGLSATAFANRTPTGGTNGGGAGAAGSGPGGSLAATGSTLVEPVVKLGLGLVIVGLGTTLLGRRRPRRKTTDELWS